MNTSRVSLASIRTRPGRPRPRTSVATEGWAPGTASPDDRRRSARSATGDRWGNGRLAVYEMALRMADEGLVLASLGNVSLREDSEVHITPTGIPYERMVVEDIVTLTLDGRPVAGDHTPSSEAQLHLAIYAAAPNVAAVVHTHSTHAVAWSFVSDQLGVGTEDLMRCVGGSVRVVGPAPAGAESIIDEAVSALHERRAVVLARHGVVGVGASLGEALDVCSVVEREAQLAWLLRNGLTPREPAPILRTSVSSWE